MSQRLLTGQHAMVTGGGQGIGLAVARALTDAGAIVTIMGRRRIMLEQVVTAGAAAGFVVADVTDADAMHDAFAMAVVQRGPIGLLVANAGGVETGLFARAEAEQFRRMFELNVMGVVHAVKAVLPTMQVSGRGRIIAMASTAGLKGYRYVSAYSAAKHAVIGLVRSLALETAGSGITVNAVCPGYTQTDLVSDSVAATAAKAGRTSDEVLADMLADKPLGRLIQPAEVADTVLWLCSGGASAITGQSIAVAGGEVM
jgi:3-hydroxybutyrate dehydrogenase